MPFHQHWPLFVPCTLFDFRQAKLEEQTVEEPKVKTVPFIDMKPEPVEVEEGKPAKFMVKVSGYPRPRVNWFVNGCLVVGVGDLEDFLFKETVYEKTY